VSLHATILDLVKNFEKHSLEFVSGICHLITSDVSGKVFVITFSDHANEGKKCAEQLKEDGVSTCKPFSKWDVKTTRTLCYRLDSARFKTESA
jgi:hypothetical protein